MCRHDFTWITEVENTNAHDVLEQTIIYGACLLSQENLNPMPLASYIQVTTTPDALDQFQENKALQTSTASSCRLI